MKQSRWLFWLFIGGQIHWNMTCSEHDLMKSIFDGYNNQIRPVKDRSTITKLGFHLEIHSILSINEQDESIDLLTWSTMIWTDEFLRWNASDFDDCDMIITLASNVWKPDYLLINSLGNEFGQIIPNDVHYAEIYNNGTVVLRLPDHHRLRCNMDITEFPFDTQLCPIIATTWTYPNTFLVYHLEKMPDLTDVRGHDSKSDEHHSQQGGNSEFETISFSGEVGNDPILGKYSEIRHMLVLKRRPEFYIFVLLIPSFLITTLCIIGTFTPNSSEGERNERMTLGLTSLLSMAVILNITADAMPKSSKGLPLLGYYVLYEIGVCSLSTVLSTLILFLHEKASTENLKPPTIIRWIASIPTPWECIKRVIICGKRAKVAKNFAGVTISLRAKELILNSSLNDAEL